MSIQNEAILVTLVVKAWTARKKDRTATEEAINGLNAAADAGNFNKVLVPPEKLKPIQKAATRLRKEFYKRTVPWGENGQYIVSSSSYVDFCRAMSPLVDEFDNAADEFAQEYPLLAQEAAMRLQGMYDPREYPSPEQVRAKFQVKLDVAPVPSSDHLLLNIEENALKELKGEVDGRIQENVKAVTKNLWGRLYQAVSHMAERLADEDAVFRNTLVTNIQELLDLLPALNVTKDEELEKMVREVREKLTVCEPDELRKDEIVRKDVARDAADIVSRMRGVFG